MNKTSVIVVCFIALFISQQAQCGLMVLEPVAGQKVTLDTVTGKYWYWNLPDFTGMDHYQQVAAIANLDYLGNDDWHMASWSEFDAIWNNYTANEIFNAFAPTVYYSDLVQVIGRIDHIWGAVGPPRQLWAWVALEVDTQIYFGELDPASAIEPWMSGPGLSAWITTDSIIVPEPSTILFGIIGVGCVNWILRRKRMV